MKVRFVGGPLDGQTRDHPDARTAISIRLPVMTADREILTYEYKRSRYAAPNADPEVWVVSNDPLKEHDEGKAKRAALMAELRELLAKYDAALEPTGYDTYGIAVYMNGVPFGVSYEEFEGGISGQP